VSHFAVLGVGSWGVTLAALLSRNGHHVTLLARSEDEADAARLQRGLVRLPEVVLEPTVEVIPSVAFSDPVDGMVVAVPVQAVRVAATAFAFPAAPLLSVAKGIELRTNLRVTELLSECAPGRTLAALSGPNLAHEVAAGMPAAAVVASDDGGAAALWQSALGGGTFRVYTSTDVIGVELGGALKNVIAIAAGAAWGYNFGANAVATIMTRGLAEMTRLGVALGADAFTFQGLAGVGDLAATCFSPLSRNRRRGELLAAGSSPAAAMATIGEAVEGAGTAPAVVELAARYGVAMPIAEQVAAVLDGRRTVADAMDQLLRRPLGPESQHRPR
jgi:glycerol-3-phosphate dehydrogenase (NAD(P)+)